MVEFGFDVVQVAAGAYAPEAYHKYIGFEVARPALARAYREVYGLEVKDLFLNEDLAIGTYRHAVATTIPQMTEVAWKKKRDQIEQVTRGIEKTRFVFNLSRRDYEQEFGKDYARPHGFGRFVAFVYALVPKMGRSPDSASGCRRRRRSACSSKAFQHQGPFRRYLEALRAGRLNLANLDLDTGRPTALGEYVLADDTYAKLLDKLDDRDYADVPAALRANILAFYGTGDERVAALAGK